MISKTNNFLASFSGTLDAGISFSIAPIKDGIKAIKTGIISSPSLDLSETETIYFRMQDKNIKIKKERSTIHPEFQGFMVFNDDPRSTGQIIFKSFLQKDPLFTKLLTTGVPHYSQLLIADRLSSEIKVNKGGYAFLPHARFVVHTHDGKPATYRVKDESRL